MSITNKTSFPLKGNETSVKTHEPELIKVSTMVNGQAMCPCDSGSNQSSDQNSNQSLLSKVEQSIQSLLSSDQSQAQDQQGNVNSDSAADQAGGVAHTDMSANVDSNPISLDNSAPDLAEIIGINENDSGAFGLQGNVDSVPRDLSIEEIEAMKKAEAGDQAEGGHDEDLTNDPYGLNYIVQSTPRDLGIHHEFLGIIPLYIPPLPPVVEIAPPPGSPPPPTCDLTAVNDNALLTVTEDICYGCDKTTISSQLTGELNVLANDSDPSGGKFFVSAIAVDNQPPVELKNGSATIDGEYGILVIKSDGSYTYALYPNVIPTSTDVEIFKYTVTDVSGCVQTAQLEINFNTIINQGPKAIDDCASLCIVETECGPCHKITITGATSVSGNVLTNDLYITPNDMIKSVSFDNQAAVALVNGQAIVKGEFGTLTINGNGTYTYVLNANAPKGCDVDVFKYTVYDPISKCFSTANLTIDTNVTVKECKPPVCEPPPCDHKPPPVCEPNPPCEPKPPVGCEPPKPPCEPPKPPVGCEPKPPVGCEPHKPPVGCEPPKPPVGCEPPKPPVGCEPPKPPVSCEPPKGPDCGHEHNPPMCGGKNLSNITITYDSSSAAYNNSFGYYIKDCNGNPTTGTIIWAGVQTTTAGDLSVTIPGVNPADIGFFIIPNGENTNSPALSNNEKVDFKEVNGVWEAVAASNPSDVIQGTGAHVFFDNSSLNADGFNHVETSVSNGVSTQSWEDLVNGGDKDFNDVVVSVKNSAVPCDMNPPKCDDHQQKPPMCDDHQQKPPKCDDHQQKPPKCDDHKQSKCDDHQQKPPMCDEHQSNPSMCGGKNNGSVTVTYDSSSASYNNSFGYYIKDCNGNPTTGAIIWAGVQTTTAGDLTFTIPDVNPADIGFFIIPNGENTNSPALSNDEKVDFKEVNGVWEAVAASNPSDVIQGTGAHVFFDNSSLNADSFNHVETSVSGNSSTLSWEDLVNGGDKDFNDVVVSVSVTAGSCKKAPICDDHGKHDKNDHHHDKLICDEKDHHSKNHDFDGQKVCGNAIKDCGDSHHDCDLKVVGYKYHNEHNEQVDGKCGQVVTTCSGSKFCMHDDGSYTHIQHDNSKSFKDSIEYTTCDAKGNHESSSFCIHTSDVKPDCDEGQKHGENHQGHDYIVDASDIQPKYSICMKDVGLNHQGKGHESGDSLGGGAQCANDNSHSTNHCLPPIVVENPVSHNCPPAIDHHFQAAVHEIHVMK